MRNLALQSRNELLKEQASNVLIIYAGHRSSTTVAEAIRKEAAGVF